MRKYRPLPREFFARDPRVVARELLGKLLVRRWDSDSHLPDADRLLPTLSPQNTRREGGAPGKLLVRRNPVPRGKAPLLAGRIVEAEAYLGAIDPGAHSYRGKTERNAVLFGPPGHAYIYFIYGNHYCTNVSCRADGESGGVLLRALEPVAGIDIMAANRGVSGAAVTKLAGLRLLTSGPGRLSQALGITRPEHNGADLCDARGGLYLGEDGTAAPEVEATPRINVTHAPHDLWRYIVPGNAFVSGPRNHGRQR